MPIIASLNGDIGGRLGRFRQCRSSRRARTRLELNIYYIPTDMNLSGAAVEQTYIDIVKAVKSAVRYPVAVKLSARFSNMANMAKRLDDAGADALGAVQSVLPARHRPRRRWKCSRTCCSARRTRMRLPMRWIAILYGRIKAEPGGDERHPHAARMC